MSRPEPGLTARAIVSRVIDGDTVEVLVTIPVTVRLRDCWAPEVHGIDRVAGMLSKHQLESLLPAKSHVLVDIDTKDVDALAGVFTFGRVLGDIWIDSLEHSISTEMVRSGYATEKKEVKDDRSGTKKPSADSSQAG